MHPQLCPCPDLKDPRDLQELFLCPSWCHPSLSRSLRGPQSWWPPSPSGAERGKGAGPSPGVQGLTRNGVWERIWWEEPGNRESKQEGEARVGNQLWARLYCFPPAFHPLCPVCRGLSWPHPPLQTQGRCSTAPSRHCTESPRAVPGKTSPELLPGPGLGWGSARLLPSGSRESQPGCLSPAPGDEAGSSQLHWSLQSQNLSWCLSWNLSQLPFMGL